MIVGIECPQCSDFVMTHAVGVRPTGGVQAFACKTCNLVIEPPNGMRDYTITTQAAPENLP
jgi:uncharacterized Zn finger protein